MEKINFKNAVKKNKNLKYGGFMTIVILFAVIAFIVVNVLFQQLKINVDLTPESLYTIGSKTTLILRDVQDDITIYGLYVNGNENNAAIALIEDYIQNCNKITYKQVDPYNNPEFTEPFRQDNETIATNSLIVVNNRTGKYKIVANSDLYERKTTPNYETYQYETVLTAFQAEQSLTSAIQYVINERTPIIYMLSGHGEAPIASNIQKLLKKANYDFRTLNLMEMQNVEANDYTIIVSNNPVQDMSQYEYDILLNYMQHGGRMIVNLSAVYPIENMPWFNQFMNRFGISAVEGTLIETNPNYYFQYSNLLIPEIGKHTITEDVEKNTVAVLMPIGLQIAENHNRLLEITPILTTSSGSVAKADPKSEVYDWEEGDQRGPFYVGLIAEEQISENNTVYYAKLAVYGSSYMFDDANGYLTAGNYNLLNGTINHLQSAYDSLYISPKNYVDTSVTVSIGTAVINGAIFVIVIPVGLILAGIIVWARRKRL